MNPKARRYIYHVTVLITCTAVLFSLFFQINKGGPFRDINPFGEDPYDAVGSFAFQGALLIAILTYARALRLVNDQAQITKIRLIRRGNSLVLAAIQVTLIADSVAVMIHPLRPSYWANVLLIELALMFLLVLICTFALFIVFKPIQTTPPAPYLTPADGINDLWTLVRIPAAKAATILPCALVEWVTCFDSDHLFVRIQWLNPRTHPWRFTTVLGLLVGIVLFSAQLQEGLPPSLAIGLLLAGIYISAELCAILLGYALLGNYLGLRPSFR